MKKFLFVLIALLSLMFFSCQKEESNTVQNLTESFTKGSPLSSLLARVSQNPTFFDNSIDGTSLFSVKLPVAIVVNNHHITIASKTDFNLIPPILSESSHDDDKINFVFPITIIYRNFQQVVVNNSAQLDAIKAGYIENQDFHEIDCIDFNYPIAAKIYNSNTQIASSKTFQNDSQLFNFIEGIQNSDIISIVYPLTMTKTNSQMVTVNNNTGLNTAIENVINDCNTINLELSNVIVSGSWHVSYFLDNSIDRTSNYSGYNFTFLTNGTSTVVKNYTSTYGNWNSYIDNGNKILNLSFSGTTIDELENDWTVIEFTVNNIRLKQIENSGSDIHYLYFTKN
jgi:hypothetical protein